jgi:hypothetical protein
MTPVLSTKIEGEKNPAEAGSEVVLVLLGGFV